MRMVFLMCAMCVAFPLLADTALSPAQEARYRTLIEELRCLVCQNQNIAESNAPLAEDLREEMRSQIAAGRTDAEIKQFLVQRYGDFVLYRPPLKPRTWLLWFGPLLLLAVAATAVAVFVRRGKKQEAAVAIDRRELQKLLDDEP